jgi:protein-disulfide isomerase
MGMNRMVGHNKKMAVVGVAAAGLFVMAFVTWLRSPNPQQATAQSRSASAASSTSTQASAATAQDAMLEQRATGSSDAPVIIYELSDFQCPYCRRFWKETLPKLKEEYIDSGKARLVFINLPLASLHPNAPAAHEFAMCAAAQDRFWQVHDLLYDHQDQWARLTNPTEFFMTLADSARLDPGPLKQCLTSGAVRPVILGDLQQAQRGSITQTPTFVIEGGVLPGAQPIEVWRPILDSILTSKTPASNGPN